MGVPQKGSKGGALLAGIISLLMGIVLIAASAGVVPIQEGSLHAPHWVLGAAGLIFVLGGSMVLATRREPAHPPGSTAAAVLQYLGGGVIVTLFALIANWIAFGPGERRFTTSISLPFLSFLRQGDDLTGRLAFGCGAVLLDALVVWVWGHGAWKAVGYFARRRSREG